MLLQELEQKGELDDGDPLNGFFKKIFAQVRALVAGQGGACSGSLRGGDGEGCGGLQIDRPLRREIQLSLTLQSPMRSRTQGDEDTRRAMMKSFVESNGTVLSTNWKDVGQKTVECTPPDGMEVKKYADV